MMMFTRKKCLLIAAACLLAFTSAQAQFEGSVSQYPTKGYEGDIVSFTMAEVAQVLDTDAATLANAVQNYISAETPDPVLFSVVSAGGDAIEWTAATEAVNHGFWLDANSIPVGHGDTSAWFISPMVENKADVNADGAVDVADISAVISVMAGTSDVDGDVNDDGAVDVADISSIITYMAGGNSDSDGPKLLFNIGQMPNVMQGGEELSATVKLTLNGKSATFTLRLIVKEKPVYNVPEPTLIESELTIVGEQEQIVEQYPRGGYDSDEVVVELGDLSGLGIPDLGLLSDQIESVLYTTWYNDADVEEGGGLKKDSLTNTPTGEGHGFWYHAVQNEQGEEDGEVAAAGWANSDKFFMNNFTYNADGNTLTCLLGQYPGVCKDNEEWFAYVYIVYGDKAYRIKYTLKLLEKEQGSGMSSYTKVGEASVTVEQEPTNDFSTISVKPDMEAIAAALGCEVGAVGMVALDDKDNFGNNTANYGGFWFNDAGTVVAYGAGCAIFIEPMNANDFSVLNVGQYPDRFAIGDEVSASVYFMNGENYYQYTVTMKIVEPKLVEHGFKSVATRTAQIQALPSANVYPIDATYEISLDDIEALIGISDPTLYGLNNDSIAAIKGQYSNAYSCDPKPGFWLHKDGYVSVWGDANARVGISYANGVFQFFQYPGRNSVGDNFKTTLFLVNEDTEEMITINFIVSFVDKLTPVETVGSENITLPVDGAGMLVKIDAQKACDALGITIDDLLNPNNYYLRGFTKEGIYGEAVNADNGLSFSIEDGGYDSYGDIFFTVEQDGDDVVINIVGIDVDDDYTVDGQFCIEVDDLRYVYYVKFVSPAIYEAGE
ncbi:MAG: DUF4859 domain-containing protein [Prevotella sp.]|nr:DUF4859 domain-containing protein [Prevotella sp.]